MTLQNANNSPTVVIRERTGSEPGCLIQALWYLAVGWWLGAAAISLAWVLNVTVIGLPLGMAILNNIPKALALQEPRTSLRGTMRRDGTLLLSENSAPQQPFWLRTVYFLLIGWWWSGIWLGVAYALCATILLMPLGLEMFRLTPAMTTLRRY